MEWTPFSTLSAPPDRNSEASIITMANMSAAALDEREKLAHKGYGRLMEIVEAVQNVGFPIEEVITSGTPAFPFAANFAPFQHGKFVHRASPGTVVYSDATSIKQ